MGVVRAVAGTLTDDAAAGRPVSGSRGAAPNVGRARNEDARVRRGARRRRHRSDRRIQAGQRSLGCVARVADAAARREPRELPSRSSDDDAAADRCGTGEADGHDCVLSRDAIGGSIMKRIAAVVMLVAGLAAAAVVPRAATATGPTIDRFLSPAYPQELVSAKKADRIAWWAYERGQRNVYTAAAPDFRPARLTQFPDDNGVEISD